MPPVAAETQTVIEEVIVGVAVLLGKSTATDPSPKPVRQAVNSVQNRVRQTLLSSHYWSFAEKREEFSRHPEVPTWGYRYSYNYPSDFLSITYVNDTGNLREGIKEYDTVNRRLNTNLERAFVSYTSDVADETLMTPNFVNAWVYHLAAEVCFQVTRDKDLKKDLKNEMRTLKMESIEIDFNNTAPQQLVSDKFVDAHVGVWGGYTENQVPLVSPEVTPINAPGDIPGGQ